MKSHNGWHAFRRGIATNLHELGVADKVIQTILRHANVATTQKHYIMVKSRNAGRVAMKQLERAIRKAKFSKQVANSKTGSKNRASRETSMDIG
ncbi:MAG: tyrosine-type recombinase/integrase [Terriglobales bacterium]